MGWGMGGDWSELVASYSRMKAAWGWANGGQPILVCYIRKYVIILGDIPVDVPQPKHWGDVSPASRRGWRQWLVIPLGTAVPEHVFARGVHWTVASRSHEPTCFRQPCLNLTNGVPYYEQRYSSATHTHAHPFNGPFPGLPRWTGTRKVNQSVFYWSKRQWVAVASAGLYASLHLAPYR